MMGKYIKSQFNAIGEENLVLADWVVKGEAFPAQSFMDIAHPTGTTRISDDPREGVVDRNCQVHGISGLYVAGSSTFPTAGHCNPTHMIVAMAIRLADHIKATELPAQSYGKRVEAKLDLKTRSLFRKEERTPSPGRVLVTGGSGKIGSHLLKELRARGYDVRALTSKRGTVPNATHDGVDWRYMDFQKSLDFSAHVEGCTAILHLSGEITNVNRMERINVEATRELAKAADTAGVRFFCLTSSVAVYGSSLKRFVDEGNPTLTPEKDLKAEYWAVDYIRKYGRTKLLGENALRETVHSMECVIVRPTVVVDIPDLIELGNWSVVKKCLAAHRHAHHIYVLDVVDAILWHMDRVVNSTSLTPGISTFNLSQDDFDSPTYNQFFKRVYAVTQNSQFKVHKAPWILDWLHDFLRFKTFPLRTPLGKMFFSNAKLNGLGYKPRYGLDYAYSKVIESIVQLTRQ